MKFNLLALFMLPFFLGHVYSCTTKSGNENQNQLTRDSIIMAGEIEAWQDSLELKRALERQSVFEKYIYASVETEPVKIFTEIDAADDPAIWVNKKHPESSLVLGTNKTWGLDVYDLSGNRLQERSIGRVNNVDLRGGFIYQNKEFVLVAASNRTNNAVSILLLNPENGFLSDTLINLKSSLAEVYGLCCYHHKSTDEFYVFVNGIGGMVEQWKVSAKDTPDFMDVNIDASKNFSSNGITGELVRSFQVGSKSEGMVADDEKGLLYIGAEQEGIYSLSADPGGSDEKSLLPGSDGNNEAIYYDIEGLALFYVNEVRYLIASSQGNFSYALFRLGDKAGYLGSFIIKEAIIDGVEETDGLDIALAPFSERFSEGLLVVQDGFNTDGDIAKNQNFKYVSFSPIKKLITSLDN